MGVEAGVLSSIRAFFTFTVRSSYFILVNASHGSPRRVAVARRVRFRGVLPRVRPFNRVNVLNAPRNVIRDTRSETTLFLDQPC